MRFKSRKTAGYQVFAVTGTNTISFAIDAHDADTEGLLGFAVERVDRAKEERYFLPGFKVFHSVVPFPEPGAYVTTFEHPVQSFVWDDFTAQDNHEYEYIFHPLKGKAKNLDRSAEPIPLTLRTEPLFSNLQHDIFFNRGVASSQAYARIFDNQKPSELEPAQRQRALDWLSRKLDDALLAFVEQARQGDTLLGCFYEFRYRPMADALRAAIERGVAVKLIVDAKKNGRVAADGEVSASFPREDNLKMLADAGISEDNFKRREAKPNDIAHNKFMVLLRGEAQQPSEVWTGSTNLSEGGIHGQTNVGHWLRDGAVAAHFERYWQLLWNDPGPHAGETDVRQQNKAFRTAVEALLATPTALDQIPQGITPIFSPRSGKAVLELYAQLADEAEKLSCITLAFGITQVFRERFQDNDADSPLAFFLLEKQDKPQGAHPGVELRAHNNVYEAWGSFLRSPLYQWTRETNALALALNQHVSYIHCKFLLRDPLGSDPIVVTGSANFSEASTNDNDENMLVIRGNPRVADIYFTEFNRLFNHYYFRSVVEATSRLPPAQRVPDAAQSLFLAENDRWLLKYKPGSLRQKRVEALTSMQGAQDG